MVRTIMQFVNLVLVGMLTGNEFGSWVTVHPALDGLPLSTHVRAEQAITQRYGRIMPFFMSATLASFLPVLVLSPDRRAASFRLSLAGLLCYGVMLAITLTRNVPLNNRLLTLSPDAPPDEFLAVRARWTRLHTARNLLNVTGLACTVGATLAQRQPLPGICVQQSAPHHVV
jgi:uncharacterized membrane protein